MQYEPDGKVLTEYLWDRSKLSIIQGPIGSGTSSASCMKVHAIAGEQLPDHDGVRRTRWLVIRNTYSELEETTIKTWLFWFPESQWGPIIRSKPMQHNLRYKHPSGDGTTVDCEVIFLAVENAEVAEKLLASFEITGFFMNEAQFQDKRTVSELLSRCSRYPNKLTGPGATWYGGFLDLNAPEEGHWIPYMRGDIPFPADFSEDQRRSMTKPKDWSFFVQPPGLIERRINGKVVYEENPLAENQKWLTEPYLRKIESMDKSQIDQRVLNKIGLYRHGQPVYPTFLADDHVAKEDVFAAKGCTIIVGLDFGRSPAAACCAESNGRWNVLSELIGENESAVDFAPRLKRHLAARYPGHRFKFYGDPRGGDLGQNNNETAFDIFAAQGMDVQKATTDNSPELRRSAMNAVLGRRYGLTVNPSCMTIKLGLGGGYHYVKNRTTGIASAKPNKNGFSHVVEALENAILGGGEGDAIVTNHAAPKAQASQPTRHKITLRRHSWSNGM